MKNLFTLLLFFICSISFTQEIQKRQITTSQIDAVFSQWDTNNKPGIAVGILNNGEIVHNKGYGLANLEHRIPITPDTKFHIGDLGKEFTVYALLLLEQRGQLSLQDDIQKFMPNLTSTESSITIQQLIHHTSGLNNIEVSKALAGFKEEDIFTTGQAYAIIQNQLKSIPKGETTQLFSDAGFIILEAIITKVSKKSYHDFVTSEIFQPLGMTNSVFDINSTVISNKAQGYFPHNKDFRASTLNSNHSSISDVYTTVGDMCLWLKELRDPKIGTVQMVKKFDTLSIVNGQAVKEANTALYTGGHRFWNFRGAKKLYHIEVAAGYASKLIRYPEYDLAVVVMGNDGAYNGYAATGVSELYIEDFLDPVTTVTTTKINSKKLSKKELSAFEGDYWDVTNHSSRKIHVVNDTLRYSRGPANESPLVPLTKKSFKMITRGEVTVNFDSRTAPNTMTVKVGDETFNLIAYDSDASWSKELHSFTGNYYSEILNVSYSLTLDQGKLILTHQRLEPMQLHPRITDVFTTNRRHFSAFEFKRDTNGTITGFHLTTRGVGGIWFQKETNLSENKIISEKL